MFRLLKGGYCYEPGEIGKKDLLVIYNKIHSVEDSIPDHFIPGLEIIDCTDRIVCPGFIDQHVHITGGGGEEGPASRIPEIMLSEVVEAGVCTVVGVLGVDNITRNIANLLAKARALEAEGLNTFIYTGSYSVPTATLTGKVASDLSIIDKVIGVGEIALADYRSSHQTVQMLKEVAWEAKVGGMIGGKAGIMHLHVGDGKDGLSQLQRLVRESDFPMDMFVPTHLNRNKALFHQAMEYVRMGGYMDLTAGEKSDIGYSVPDAIEILAGDGLDMEKVTVSSDANGSVPGQGGGSSGVGKVYQLYEDIRNCILQKRENAETAIKMVTSNVAKILKLYPRKGTLRCGSDADILVLDRENLKIEKLFINGEIFIQDGKVIRRGKYEKS